ncbi:Mitochondrial import receptor subunit tom20 [Psilocybe cubensis]|uniref:Mitochondrial import receptor subunit tom20 n=1 Tax=Psilocybe cubensis TaxID=181762 RepID=A0ACB8H2Z2_PSICU|nr:Mitochondrial import receptor subunit tom20 [Psilocybe cubensis]KAH9482350.1 Mitochondrial import receptor subunit tom20 [Psilocybe cubensis]
MDNRSTSYITLAAVSLAAGLAAYAVYFDYKRRNDVEFRKKLKKEKKRVEKAVAQSKQSELAESSGEIDEQALREVIKTIRSEPGPQTSDEKEGYFMSQVSIGEQLSLQGPRMYLPAAAAFFRALRVYPSPVELIGIYEKTIVDPVFKVCCTLFPLAYYSPTTLFTAGHAINSVRHLDDNATPPRGPPSETSSQEWDKLTDPDSHPSA